jgi:hypothetical protein
MAHDHQRSGRAVRQRVRRTSGSVRRLDHVGGHPTALRTRRNEALLLTALVVGALRARLFNAPQQIFALTGRNFRVT